MISDSMAASALSVLRGKADQRATEIGSIGDQLVIAADLKPRKFLDEVAARSLRRSYCTQRRRDCRARTMGTTAREFAHIDKHSNGKTENPSNVQLLGGGRRAGTLRSRVRSIQKFIG